MQRRAFLIGSVLPLVARAQGNPKSPSLEPVISQLEKQIPNQMQEIFVSGLSIAVVKDGKFQWRRGFGISDSVSKEPVDNDTIFEAASMSKPVFAYAVMKLCEKGVMDLDTPLTKYTSERVLDGDPRLELISARHVLSHTSGFQNWRSEESPLKIHVTPGEKYRYSGEGYSYLQSVVAHLTRQHIEPYMKANLFGPFGMVSSGYVWNDMFEKRMSRPHDPKGKPFDNNKSTETSVARYGSAGALLTTPTDYAKFLIEVIDPKPSDAYRLTKKSLEEMVRPQVKVNEEYSTSWALGWGIQHSGKRNFIMHGGDNKGFHSFAVGSVDEKSRYVMMTNGENGSQGLKNVMAGWLKPFMERS